MFNNDFINILFNILPIIVPIFIFAVFVLIIAMNVSPRFKGKMMSREIKAKKYMMDESKEDLKSISDDMAYATKDGVKATVGAIREGLTKTTIFCKHCGSEIDEDSKFCKKCGKEQ